VRAKWFALFSLVLVVATVGLYARVNGYDFVNYDDTLYVTQNVHVQAGLTWPTVTWAFTTFHVGTWHPLTWLSHALDCQLFDLDAAGPHDINLLLHVLNAVVLFWVLQRATGYLGRSFVVAALFALHPINVESVVWIAERKNSLSLLFFLLALGAYNWYVEKPDAKRYSVVALLFALGLMAKPQVITFPFVLLLWDYWPLGRVANRHSPLAIRQNGPEAVSGEGRTANSEWRRLILEKLPLFAMAGVSAAITMAAERADGNKFPYPLGLRLEYAIVSYPQYLAKAFWPIRLSPFYPHPDYVSLGQVAGAVVLLGAITLFAVAYRRTRPYLMVGWFFFLGTLVPMLGLAGVGYQGRQGIADRYGYLPFIGLFLMVCWGLAEWSEQGRLPRTVQAVAGVVVLVALGVVASHQLSFWRDDIALWSRAIHVTQGNFLAENNLGKALLKQGRVEEGAAHLYKAVTLYPTDPVGNMNLGIYEQSRGRYAAAIDHFNTTLANTRDPELRAAAARSAAAARRQLGQ
jgi:hypothetical protein